MKVCFIVGVAFLILGYTESQGITSFTQQAYYAVRPPFYSYSDEGQNVIQVLRFLVQTGYYFIGAALIGLGFYLKTQRN